MSSVRWPRGSADNAAGPGKVSRFEELLWQLQQEHLRVVKQTQEEVAAGPSRRAVPQHTLRAGAVIFDDPQDIDAFAPLPPIAEKAQPQPPPLEISCLEPATLSGSAPVLDLQVDLDKVGSIAGATEKRDRLGAGTSESSDYGRRAGRASSVRTAGSTHTSDSNNGVRHVRRMLDRWHRAGSQMSMEDDRSPEGPRASVVTNFISSKVRSFLESAEAANLFDPRSAGAEETNRCYYLVKKVVTSPTFELIFATLIFVNTLVLAIEAQYDGIQSGYENGLGRMETPSSEIWPGADSVFVIFEMCFGILFTVEVAMKIFAMRRDFVRDVWNAVDLIIVVFWLLESVFKAFLPLDPKMVRMARLARLLRFLRIVKTIQAFDSLYLIVASIKSSFSALAWSSVVLLLGEMMLALFLNVLLEDYWSNDANLDEDREEMYGYFGTFTKAFQTMIEMLLGNWYTITRVLTSKVSEWYMIFGVTHQLVVGFAVIEVITGVFLHETFKVANLDDGILLNETKREIKDQTEKMMRFFKHADIDDDGELDREEFRQVLTKDRVQEWMNAQGLDVHNIDKVFGLFDKDRNGRISPEELIAGTLNLKGQAKAMELAIVRAMVEDIHRALKNQRSAPVIAAHHVGEPSRAVGEGEQRPGKAWRAAFDDSHASSIGLPGSIGEEPR